MIKVISGERFKDLVVGAAALLENYREKLNDLNVFPVPDGDTGTNMSMTMMAAAKEVVAADNSSFKNVVDALSVGALKGARGNSGVILSQIWRGFCSVLAGDDVKELDTQVVAKAINSGVECAYKAILKPKEGTILTVASSMAKAAMEYAENGGSDDIAGLMEKVLEEGEATLKKTPDMLPVLKEAGVVDAGGAGLVIIFRGFKLALEGSSFENVDSLELEAQLNAEVETVSTPGELNADIEFGYCTEFFIKHLFEHVDMRDIDGFRNELTKLGDCVLVVGDIGLVKVHVHTNDPGIVLQHALTLGMLSQIKIDNMREQHRELKEEAPQREQKPMAIVSVVAGEGLKAVFRDCMVEDFVEGGQTMNPSTEDILKVIDAAPSNNVIVLPNNKNIILAAEQAAELSKKNVKVVPSRSIPQGISAVLNYNCEEDFDYNVKKLCDSLSIVKTGQVTYAVRDTVLDGKSIHEGEYIGLGEGDIVSNGSDIIKVGVTLAESLVDDDSSAIEVYYGSDVCDDDANRFKAALGDKFDMCDVEVHYGGQAVYSYILSIE